MGQRELAENGSNEVSACTARARKPKLQANEAGSRGCAAEKRFFPFPFRLQEDDGDRSKESTISFAGAVLLGIYKLQAPFPTSDVLPLSAFGRPLSPLRPKKLR
jgi:hypothetical protein